MAKHIVKYSLDFNGNIPRFIENGGHFPIGDELVGLSKDMTLPEGIEIMDRAELLSRIESLQTELSTHTSEEILENFLAMMGKEDLA